MARLVNAYACDFKCGTKVLTSKKAMEKHEERCFYNPARKACASCVYFESYNDSDGSGNEWRHNECLANEDIDLSTKLRHGCGLHKPN